MAGNQKPRKKYRPRPVFVPLKMRDGWKIEGNAKMRRAIKAALKAMKPLPTK